MLVSHSSSCMWLDTALPPVQSTYCATLFFAHSSSLTSYGEKQAEMTVRKWYFSQSHRCTQTTTASTPISVSVWHAAGHVRLLNDDGARSSVRKYLSTWRKRFPLRQMEEMKKKLLFSSINRDAWSAILELCATSSKRLSCAGHNSSKTLARAQLDFNVRNWAAHKHNRGLSIKKFMIFFLLLLLRFPT